MVEALIMGLWTGASVRARVTVCVALASTLSLLLTAPVLLAGDPPDPSREDTAMLGQFLRDYLDGRPIGASRLLEVDAAIRRFPRPHGTRACQDRAWRTFLMAAVQRRLPLVLLDMGDALGWTDKVCCEEIRKAEQDAIWSTLEKHGLARRHVGRRRLPRPSPGPRAPGENG